MPTGGRPLSETPINLVDSLGLVVDQRYTLEATGQTDVLVNESTTEPDEHAYWHILHRNTGASRLGLLVKEGVGVWARAPIQMDEVGRPSFYGTCIISVTEAE